jgi:hypothetical protein
LNESQRILTVVAFYLHTTDVLLHQAQWAIGDIGGLHLYILFCGVSSERQWCHCMNAHVTTYCVRANMSAEVCWADIAGGRSALFVSAEEGRQGRARAWGAVVSLFCFRGNGAKRHFYFNGNC